MDDDTQERRATKTRFSTTSAAFLDFSLADPAIALHMAMGGWRELGSKLLLLSGGGAGRSHFGCSLMRV